MGNNRCFLKSNSMKKILPSTFFLIALLLAGSNVTAPALGLNTAGAQVESEAQELDEAVNVDENENETLDAVEEQEAANTAGNAAAAAAASQGTIYVGPSASGDALRILSQGYTLVPLTGGPISGPVVVGAGDLFVPWIGDQLVAAYEQGHAVALTNATTFDIDQLRNLLAHRGAAHPSQAGTRVDLAAFRETERSDGQCHFSSHLLLSRVAPTAPKPSKKAARRLARLPKKVKRRLQRLAKQQQGQQQGAADKNDLQALNRIFSAVAPVPAPPPGDPQNDLVKLAESYESHAIQTDFLGNQVQLINTVWDVRSFRNSSDYYYVMQEADYHAVALVSRGGGGFPELLILWDNSVTSFSSGPPILIQASPQTTLKTRVENSGISFNIGGAAGWNQMQGLNATASGGVTISNQTTTTIPPITIENASNLQSGTTEWHYQVNDVLDAGGSTLAFFNHWIWQIPFDRYLTQWVDAEFSSQATMKAGYGLFGFLGLTDEPTVNLTSVVPLPFGRTFALQQPAVTSVNPTTVNAGDTFAINGTGFYPNLVQAVLIGGTAVDQANVTTVSDTQINVVAPDFVTCEFGCTVVVQTTQGASNDNVTISILPNP